MVAMINPLKHAGIRYSLVFGIGRVAVVTSIFLKLWENSWLWSFWLNNKNGLAVSPILHFTAHRMGEFNLERRI